MNELERDLHAVFFLSKNIEKQNLEQISDSNQKSDVLTQKCLDSCTEIGETTLKLSAWYCNSLFTNNVIIIHSCTLHNVHVPDLHFET